MTLQELQQAFAVAAQQRVAATTQRLHANESRKKAASTLSRLDRGEGDPRTRDRWAAQHAKLEAEAARAHEQMRASAARERELIARIAALGHPAAVVRSLEDRWPFVLFPLRLETRFKTTGQTAQLWLRIYPDDCQVETFTETMTDHELRDVEDFWIGWWKAGGIEAQQRAAWRKLVQAHGSGRGGWLTEKHAPVDRDGEPRKPDPMAVILVAVEPASGFSAADRAAAATYYLAVWRADGDATARAAAAAALASAVGAGRAQSVADAFRPANLDDEPPPPAQRADVAVSFATIRFPDPGVTTQMGWVQAPRVTTLPERFVVIGYQGGTAVLTYVTPNPVPGSVAVGPDPSLGADEQIQRDADGELVLDDELRWIADFDRAVEQGLGARIDLTAAQAHTGFDRLIVLGVRLRSDAQDGATTLEALLSNHLHGRNGLSVLSQGTPTNNTDDGDSGYSWLDDAEATFDRRFGSTAGFAITDDVLAKRDGQWLAEYLGIAPALLQAAAHADGVDQLEARAANAALWPATGGYFLDEMLRGTVNVEDADRTRTFFLRYVSGRGAVPALRIGKQPYGVIAATAWSRLAFGDAFSARLVRTIHAIESDFRRYLGATTPLDQAPDPHQALLDVLGLDASSVEWFQRYAQSAAHLYNQAELEAGSPYAARVLAAIQRGRATLLQGLGLHPDGASPIFDKIFRRTSVRLAGPVIDDVPLSETSRVRAYAADGKNYLEWLATATLEQIRTEDLGGKPAPSALLYLYLRHARLLSHWDAALRVHVQSPAIAELRREADFIGISSTVGGTSKYAPLYADARALTGGRAATLAEYFDLPDVLATSTAASRLRDLKQALSMLSQTPTARLERLFAEHVDTCSYRIDSWKLALAARRHEELRTHSNEGAWSRGAYLGAYGCLENVRPQPARARANAGFIHAPSLNHAHTAAVLKSAYLSHATPEQREPFAIDLSSDRVRMAELLLDGMRTGQSLGALLGYQLERGLHDRGMLGPGQVDRFIYALRSKFPLVANKQPETSSTDTPVELVEARNVVDGLQLLEQVRKAGTARYPFGLPTGTAPGQLPVASVTEAAALDAEVDRLANAQDAVADLMLAETVHQSVLGNPERASAAADVLRTGAYPHEPDVVRTPRSGKVLTHRFALVLDAEAPPSAAELVPPTPRALAEPALDRWLSTLLPAPDRVVCAVTYDDPDGTRKDDVAVSQQDIGLRAIDLLHVGTIDGAQAMSELDDRIEHIVRTVHAPRPGAFVRLDYTRAVPGKITFFELGALLREVQALVLRARPLEAGDLQLAHEARAGQSSLDADELALRVTTAIDALAGEDAPLVALASNTTMPTDDYARAVASRFLEVARHGPLQTGIGEIYRAIADVRASVERKLRALLERWRGKQTTYDALITSLPTLADDAARITALQQAERAISATDTRPTPTAPGAYLAQLAPKRIAFDGALDALAAPLTSSAVTLETWLSDVAAVLPRIAAHDRVWFDLDRQANDLAPELAMFATLRTTLAARVAAVRADAASRVSAARALLAEAASTADARAAIALVTSAARKVLGDQARVVPRFALGTTQATELARCWAARDQLLSHLTSAAIGRLFPVDDWLAGVARVRDKLGAWERGMALADALGGRAGQLAPLQLPFRTDDRWAALELPANHSLDGEKLLLTACFAAPLDTSHAQAGLLFDEWTEILPASEQTTGIAFHFDQPDSEPPQAWLVVAPPADTGRWQWDDLVDAVIETLELARLRTLEPRRLAATPYAQLLPATIMAVTLHGITIATNLAANVGLETRLV